MKCPHCLVEYHSSVNFVAVVHDKYKFWYVSHDTCPNCQKAIITLQERIEPPGLGVTYINKGLIYPKTISRLPLSEDVPEEYASDYKEACLVLSDSPKASAALSRRCLQNILHNKLSIKKANLYQEIQEVIDRHHFPTEITDSIDSIRHIGNFASHPMKSTNSGEIFDVEPHEAEWNLEVLEMLFDYLFVRPANIAKRKNALNLKLKDAGKPEMK